MAQRSKGKTSSLWAPSGLLAALFLMAGGSKLGGAEKHVRGLAHWGWPDWMRLIGGAVEVAASVLLLIPRVAFVGACALAVVMAGATFTHLFRATSEGGLAALTVVLLVLAGLVAYSRRSDAFRLGDTSTADRKI